MKNLRCIWFSMKKNAQSKYIFRKFYHRHSGIGAAADAAICFFFGWHFKCTRHEMTCLCGVFRGSTYIWVWRWRYEQSNNIKCDKMWITSVFKMRTHRALYAKANIAYVVSSGPDWCKQCIFQAKAITFRFIWVHIL